MRPSDDLPADPSPGPARDAPADPAAGSRAELCDGAPDRSGDLVHPRRPPRRGSAAPRTWWGRAWVRATDEATYDDRARRRASALARSGAVGPITVTVGGLSATVDDGSGLFAPVVVVPVLDVDALDALVEVVAAETARLPALLAGDLPHALIEHAEESGVELLPYGEELGTQCSCTGWLDRCPHALAVLDQVGWLVEADPLLLVHLRGLPREELLARVRAATGPAGGGGGGQVGSGAVEVDLDVAWEAVIRARVLLERLEADAADAAGPDRRA